MEIITRHNLEKLYGKAARYTIVCGGRNDWLWMFQCYQNEIVTYFTDELKLLRVIIVTGHTITYTE